MYIIKISVFKGVALDKFLNEKIRFGKYLENLPALGSEPAVSIVLSSKRVTDLSSILEQILNFEYSNFKLNLALHEISPGRGEERLIKKLKNEGKIERVATFSNEFNLGMILSDLASKSSGELVAKIDDDDFYEKFYLTNLVRDMKAQNVDVIGKALNYIYLASIESTILRVNELSVSNPFQRDEWVCGGTILVKRDIGAKAGWFGQVPSGVDRFLLSGVKNQGGVIYRTHGYGYIYTRNNLEHTYNTSNNKYLEGQSALMGGIYGF